MSNAVKKATDAGNGLPHVTYPNRNLSVDERMTLIEALRLYRDDYFGQQLDYKLCHWDVTETR